MPTFDTPEPIIADIEILVGRVRINAGDRGDTVVQVHPSDPSSDSSVQAAKRTLVELSGDRLRVRGPKGKGLAYLLAWRGSIDVTIDLPAGARVDAKVSSADLLATGRLGECSVKCSNGDIRFEETGRLEAKTSNGEISVDRIAGPAELAVSNGAIRIGASGDTAVAKCSNGDITVGEVTGDLLLNTGSGDITLDRVLAGVTAKTAYGRVRIRELVRGSARLETGYGKTHIGIAEGTAAWLDLHSKHGVVRSTLTASEGPEEGEAVAEIHAHSNYGDIDVHRS